MDSVVSIFSWGSSLFIIVTTVVISISFYLFKNLTRRGHRQAPKSSQKKNKDKKDERKSDKQSYKSDKVSPNSAKSYSSQPLSPKVASDAAQAVSAVKKDNSPKKRKEPITMTVEDDWVAVKPGKSQSSQSVTSASTETAQKQKPDVHHKKGQKDVSKKTETSPQKMKVTASAGKQPSEDDEKSAAVRVTPPVSGNMVEDDWQEIPSTKKKKSRARKE
uniref:Ribosome receptor lysine/proline rich domain-containing protein n=1 Tax=Mesocestoides corti TaxID=53468 RepID=A0A5K3F457_MESCO